MDSLHAMIVRTVRARCMEAYNDTPMWEDFLMVEHVLSLFGSGAVVNESARSSNNVSGLIRPGNPGVG